MGSERDPEGRLFVPLADAYRRMGDLASARELLEDGLTSLPGFASGHLVLGLTCRDQGDREGAITAFRRVLTLDGENVIALTGLGELLHEEGEPAEARRLLGRAMEFQAEDEELRARIREIERDWRRAEEASWADVASGSETEAEAALGVEEDAGSGDESAREPFDTRTIAELFVKQQLYEEAIGVLGRLIEAEPGDAALRARLAEVREMAGEGKPEEKKDTIKRYFERMMNWTPPTPGREVEAPETSATVPAGSSAPALSGPEPVVPIESLAPDLPGPGAVVPIESLAPDLPGPGAVVPIESLVPASTR